MQCSEIERLHPAGGNSLKSVSGGNKARQNRTHLNKSAIKVPENKTLFFSLLTAGNILKGGVATSITASVPSFLNTIPILSFKSQEGWRKEVNNHS